MPPSLLSRFDLIYLLLDKVNEQSDKELAKHITSLFLESSAVEENNELYSIEELSVLY